jgi:hypothetical protein
MTEIVTDGELIGHYEMIDALEAVIKDSSPEKRAALRDAIEAWGKARSRTVHLACRKPEGNA